MDLGDAHKAAYGAGGGCGGGGFAVISSGGVTVYGGGGSKPVSPTEQDNARLRQERADFRNKWAVETERADIAEAAFKRQLQENAELRLERDSYLQNMIAAQQQRNKAQAELAAFSQIAYSATDIAKLEEETRNLHDRLMWADGAIRERDKRIAELERKAKLLDAMKEAFSSGGPYQSKDTRDISRAIASVGDTERTHGLMHFERYS